MVTSRRPLGVALAVGLTVGAVGFGLSPAGAAGELRTIRVSVSSTGEQASNYSNDPSISADGRFVAFRSNASNLVKGDTNRRPDVFVYDRATHKTLRVSVSSAGMQGNGDSAAPSISAQGRFVAFWSRASNLVRGDTNRQPDVFVYDRATHQTQRVSVNSTGAQGHGGWSRDPSISADGRFVAFTSGASNLVRGDTNNHRDVFVYDRATHQTQRVSANSTGAEAHANSYDPSISADGRFVAFGSGARNLIRADPHHRGVFVYDRVAGVVERVSASSTGEPADANSWGPSISADGRFVAFTSDASNLAITGTRYSPRVYVHDRSTGKTRLITFSSAGRQAHGDGPSISAHGRFVAFWSSARNLVAGDTNHQDDVFVRGPLR